MWTSLSGCGETGVVINVPRREFPPPCRPRGENTFKNFLTRKLLIGFYEGVSDVKDGKGIVDNHEIII